MELPEGLHLDAEWTDDCQGKKDYDGDILSISSRYWPRGGGFTLITPEREWQDNDARPHIRPSATSELHLHHQSVDRDSPWDWTVLASERFEADTQEEVQRQVEVWAQGQMDRVVAILREHL